jgi:hypothetical protein
VLDYHRSGRLLLYVDLHAHAPKRGCFFYGNVLDGNDLDQQVGGWVDGWGLPVRRALRKG